MTQPTTTAATTPSTSRGHDRRGARRTNHAESGSIFREKRPRNDETAAPTGEPRAVGVDPQLLPGVDLEGERRGRPSACGQLPGPLGSTPRDW